MGSLNKAMIIGFLGNDPDMRYTDTGAAVCTISVATTARWNDKQTGEQKERTEWHRCVAWGKQAETIAEYLRKGSQVYVEGELQTRKWTDKDDIDRYSTEIRIFQFSFLDRKGEGGGSRPPHPSDSNAPTAETSKQQQTDAGSADQGQTGEDEEDFDDSIPF